MNAWLSLPFALVYSLCGLLISFTPKIFVYQRAYISDSDKLEGLLWILIFQVLSWGWILGASCFAALSWRYKVEKISLIVASLALGAAVVFYAKYSSGIWFFPL
jgi:hypothetical protein